VRARPISVSRRSRSRRRLDALERGLPVVGELHRIAAALEEEEHEVADAAVALGDERACAGVIVAGM
jgi:hypothetical protein